VPRRQLSEFRAKSLLSAALQQAYNGWEIDAEDKNWRGVVSQLSDDQRYVVKVDQAEKGRFKKGLVKLDRDKRAVEADVTELFATGYRFALIEIYQPHAPDAERYLAIERTRQGLQISFSGSGGVDVESATDSMRSALYGSTEMATIDVPPAMLSALVQVFEDTYMSFLEINPLVLQGDKLQLLDAAVEVDSEAQFFEEGWQESDLRRAKTRQLTPQETAVQTLASQSQASFSLELIHPNGSIFLLLSGGGASVVVADEVHNLGFGEQLANYGEYSGNPNLEETQLYTEQVVQLLLASTAPKKVLIIGGGVANFTDIRTTFTGVIAALRTYEQQLKAQSVTVFVRRGGPHEREGLAAIRAYLEELGIAGTIASPELLLSDIVKQAVKVL
jgi:succinyl-CoA synthetase beta subunit